LSESGRNPGDGNDTVEGQAGTDRLVFNGANISEHIDLAANGGRLRLSRDVASIIMDVDDVELVDVNTLGGTDTVSVGNLGGTDVTAVHVDLAAVLGGTTGDGQPDTVIVDASNGDDVVVAGGDASGVSVSGIAAFVSVTGADAASDTLRTRLLAGDDVLDASGLSADATRLEAFGGDGNDVILGGEGDDSLYGEEGDDVLIGNGGLDLLDGGPGDNIVIQ
jgi:Ca2+-binding RTX toxin-like protein